MEDREKIKAWFRRCMEATGWSPNEWATEAKIAPTSITRLLNEKPDKPASLPTFGTLQKLATAITRRFEIELDAMGKIDEKMIPLARKGRKGIQSDTITEKPSSPKEMGAVEGNRADLVIGNRDFPILASRDHREGLMIVQPNTIGLALRPSAVQENKDAFQTTMVADDMVPKYRRGDKLIIAPHVPVEADDFVFVVLETLSDGARIVMIRQLIERAGDKYTLLTLTTGAKQTLDRSEFVEIYKIAGSFER